MKTGDTYRFSLSWPMDTKERILAGEFLGRLGNKKSRFIVQLICDYLNAHPEALDPKEAVRFIVSSTSIGEKLADMIRKIIQSELAGKAAVQLTGSTDTDDKAPDADDNIDDMLGNLDIWDK